MSASKGVQRRFWEQRDATERARTKARAWIDELLEDRRRRFPTMLAMSKELHRWRSWPAEPWTIWMGPGEYRAWRLEIADPEQADEFYGVPIVQVKDSGVSFMHDPEALVN